MRQAGRHLPEFRALRAQGYDFFTVRIHDRVFCLLIDRFNLDVSSPGTCC